MFGNILPGVKLQRVRVNIVNPYLVNLVGDDRLPLFSLLESNEIEEMKTEELTEVIIERMSLLAEMLDGTPIAILCDNRSTKALRACLSSIISSQIPLPLGQVFFRNRDGRYRSIGQGPISVEQLCKETLEYMLFENGEDLDDFLSQQYLQHRSIDSRVN